MTRIEKFVFADATSEDMPTPFCDHEKYRLGGSAHKAPLNIRYYKKGNKFQRNFIPDTPNQCLKRNVSVPRTKVVSNRV